MDPIDSDAWGSELASWDSLVALLIVFAVIVVGLFVFGAALAIYFKYRDPRRFELIGRIVYDETEVRE